MNRPGSTGPNPTMTLFGGVYPEKYKAYEKEFSFIIVACKKYVLCVKFQIDICQTFGAISFSVKLISPPIFIFSPCIFYWNIIFKIWKGNWKDVAKIFQNKWFLERYSIFPRLKIHFSTKTVIIVYIFIPIHFLKTAVSTEKFWCFKILNI